MEMQNVKNLTIPEGNVKTIHDKDNRLIWGAVGYDTKYTGDTTQQTYSGVNLFNKDAALSNQYLNASGGWTSGSYSFVNQEYSGVTASNITVSFTSRTGSAYVRLGEYDSDDTFIQRQLITTNTTVALANNTAKIIISVDNDGGTRFENLQIEYGSAATDYEPYTGGIPAPSPDYPQTVNVVTGVQTITLSAGSQSETFTVDLGALELCKIGTYQDYIYKSGSDWYVHKANGKYVSTGQEPEWYKPNTSSYPTLFQLDTTELGLSSVYTTSSMGPGAYCKYFIFKNSGDVRTEEGFALYNNAQRESIRVNNSNYTDMTDFKTWLGDNQVTFYYALKTPTDTQITDSTLIGQLNAVHEWLTRYGYSFTVTGTLPIIIEQTNL